MTANAREYPDPRFSLINAEVSRYSVAIVPVLPADTDEELLTLDVIAQGSGTCIRIGGRFFVATAAHVVAKFPVTRYAVLTPITSDQVLKVIAGGRRGGGPRDDLDVAWLELSGRAAAAAGRSFLDLGRLAPYCDGADEALCIYGAPTERRVGGTKKGLPSFTAVASMWETRAMTAEQVGDVDRKSRIHVEWPRVVRGHNNESYAYPEPHGISGGAVWSLNTKSQADAWRPEHMQLIGIEFAVQRARGYRYLIGQQIHVWLEMLAEDVPELAPSILAHLAGARIALQPRG
jgi:hypothetical protein